MKLILNKLIGMHLAAMTAFLSSCVNSIPEETAEPSDIPITISADILCKNTRLTDTSFETNDATGLYVLIQPKRIDQERYINNVKLTCPELSNLEPESPLFYPAGDDVKCEFIGYYPYQESGITEKNNSINVSIKTDQSADDAYSQSDFMVANNKDVTPSKKVVPLNFQHKLSKVQIVLSPQPGEDAQALFDSNPEVILSGFHSKASYNFSTEQFSSFEESGSIDLHGTWELKNGKLIGKEANLLPEPLADESHRIVINVAGKSSICVFPENYSTESGTKSILTLSYSASEGLQSSKMDYSIDKWVDGINGETNSEATAINISTSSMTFGKSGMYKIMSNGKQIAEVCKEYLLSDKINEQAIVAYPYVNGKADLSKGTVIEFPESPNTLVGGNVSWSSDNALTYTPGNSSSTGYIYFTKEHGIAFSALSTPLPVWSEEYILTDIREKETLNYPIVKIGTQYWMAGNLQATKYTDGNKITKKTSAYSEPAGYYSANNYKFYNAAAVNTGKLAPAGWKVPTQAEWGTLSSYVKGNASLLKAGTWSTDDGKPSGTPYPVLNKAGFNGYPVGYFTEKDDKIALGGNQQITNFWMSVSEKEVAKTSFFLYCKNNEISNQAPIKHNALSVRCIRK